MVSHNIDYGDDKIMYDKVLKHTNSIQHLELSSVKYTNLSPNIPAGINFREHIPVIAIMSVTYCIACLTDCHTQFDYFRICFLVTSLSNVPFQIPV